MDVIDLGKNSFEDLVAIYAVDRLINYPVKSCREWLQDCTNAVEWCGSDVSFDKFVYLFECHYSAYVGKLCSLKGIFLKPIYNQSK